MILCVLMWRVCCLEFPLYPCRACEGLMGLQNILFPWRYTGRSAKSRVIMIFLETLFLMATSSLYRNLLKSAVIL